MSASVQSPIPFQEFKSLFEFVNKQTHGALSKAEPVISEAALQAFVKKHEPGSITKARAKVCGFLSKALACCGVFGKESISPAVKTRQGTELVEGTGEGTQVAVSDSEEKSVETGEGTGNIERLKDSLAQAKQENMFNPQELIEELGLQKIITLEEDQHGLPIKYKYNHEGPFTASNLETFNYDLQLIKIIGEGKTPNNENFIELRDTLKELDEAGCLGDDIEYSLEFDVENISYYLQGKKDDRSFVVYDGASFAFVGTKITGVLEDLKYALQLNKINGFWDIVKDVEESKHYDTCLQFFKSIGDFLVDCTATYKLSEHDFIYDFKPSTKDDPFSCRFFFTEKESFAQINFIKEKEKEITIRNEDQGTKYYFCEAGWASEPTTLKYHLQLIKIIGAGNTPGNFVELCNTLKELDEAGCLGDDIKYTLQTKQGGNYYLQGTCDGQSFDVIGNLFWFNHTLIGVNPKDLRDALQLNKITGFLEFVKGLKLPQEEVYYYGNDVENINVNGIYSICFCIQS